jgi:hypothetical protein
MAQEHVERSKRLTPHHRVHGISLTIEAEELTGSWAAIRDISPRVEEVVNANSATPCLRNARSLLLCGLAHALAGDEARAVELERAANELEMESPSLIAPRIRLAFARSDLDGVRSILEENPRPTLWFGLGLQSARLDALAALRDTAQVEREAPPYLGSRVYLEPFALRALGIVRDDAALLEQADERFAALGLDWYRALTPALLAGTNPV